MAAADDRATAGPAPGPVSGAAVPILPREHGTWAMLLVPWAVGCGVARRLGPAEVLLLAAFLAAFLGHGLLVHRARLGLARRPDRAARARAGRLAAGFALLAALAAVPLLGRRPALLLLGALGLALAALSVGLVRARRDRALAGQVLGALALPLAAPAAHYVARGALDAVGLALWLLDALFFLGAVLYVRLKIEALARKAAAWPLRARLGLAAPTLGLDAGIAAAVGATLAATGLPLQVGLAFVPVALQTAVGVLRLHRPARLRRLGLLATAHAAAFGALLIWLA